MNRRENHSLSGRRARYVLLGALLAVLLPAACGKKGPLYLPDDANPSNQAGPSVEKPAASQIKE